MRGFFQVMCSLSCVEKDHAKEDNKKAEEERSVNKRVWDEIPWKAKIFWAVVLGLTLFRVALFLSIPVEALANADHDDLLQVNQGCFLFAGQWLGPYNSRTLSKGISFPFFLAVCKWLCMPYGLGLALFYIASILVFLRAIKTFINNPYLKGILYLFFLYSPAMLSSSTQQRAYNIAVVPPTILLVAGGFIGMFLRRDQGVRKMLPWSVLAGFSFAYFWNIRQDSMWFAPFAAGAAAITILCILLQKKNWKKKITSVFVACLPFLLFEGVMLGISAVNYHYYGIFTTNERAGTSCADVMADLIQMDVPQVNESVWVSRETLERAMEYSETLESIRPSINKIYESGWATSNGEIPGDIIVWALRDAVEYAGYFTDGATSEGFFAQVHKELTEAYEEGAYTKKKGIFLSSLSDQFIPEEDFIPLLNTSLTAIRRILFAEETTVEVYTGSGTNDQLRLFESVLGSPVVYPDGAAFERDPVASAASRPVSAGQKLIKLYRLLLYVLVPLGFFCYLWMTVSMIKGARKKRYDDLHCWLITTGLIGSSLVQIVAVSWFTTFLHSQHHIYHYCTGSLTIIQLVQIFTILWALRRFLPTLLPDRKMLY